MKYLVMESFESYAVLLAEDGRFLRSANLGYEVGDTVENPVLMRDKPLEKRRMPVKLITAITAIAAMVALFFGYQFYQDNYVGYSSIFMAVNPEVEMILNKNGEVLEIDGVNKDGIALLEGYEPASEDKVEVANELVERAISMGFLAEGDRVSFAIDTPERVLFEKYGIELREEVSGSISITIEITDMENRNRPEPEPEPEPVVEEEPEPEPDPEPAPEPKPAPAPAPAPKPAPKPEPKPTPPPAPEAPKMISLAEAKQIAFSHAGVNGANASFDDQDLDSDDGVSYYDLEFDVGEDEYEYQIHAYTGQILDYDIDLDNDDD